MPTLLFRCLSFCLLACLMQGALTPRAIAQPLPKRHASAQAARRHPIWCLYQGKTVKNAVNSWAQRAGWTLQWQFRYDYPIVITTCFQGSFLQAIQALTHAYDQAEYPFYLDLYPPQRLAIISD